MLHYMRDDNFKKAILSVDDDIPLPKHATQSDRKTEVMKLAEKMKVGQSVLIKGNSQKVTFINNLKRIGYDYASERQSPPGVALFQALFRVWKLEKTQ